MNDKKIEDIEKELKELNKLLSRSILKQEKIRKALGLIDELIKGYESDHKMFVTSDQPDKVDVTKRSIDRFDKIRKILEE